jgi:dTDP-4-dehydrorhamnose reductase
VKILLFGRNVQVGWELRRALAPLGELHALGRDAADLAVPESLAAPVRALRPDVIVNAAAYTAVDQAESETDLARRVNAESPAVLAREAAALGAWLVHYGTDYVFDGSGNAPRDEGAPTGPLNVYGRTKLEGEEAIRASGARHLVLRTSWVYAAHGHNFLRTMLRLGAERDELRVVSDQHGAPTDTGLIVDGTLAALDRWLQSDSAQRRILAGTHHLVASGATSWHGFASAIFEQATALGMLARPPRVVPISSAEFPTPAVRPAWSLLDNGGFRQHFDFPLPDWQHGLRDVMRRLAASGH